MKKIFINKIFIIILIFIAIIFSFTSSCYSTDNFTYTSYYGVTMTFPDFSSYITEQQPFVFIISFDGGIYLVCTSHINNFGLSSSYITYLIEDNTWYFLNDGAWAYNRSFNSTTSNPYVDDIYYSNSTLFDSDGNVFFQVAPQPQGETQQETQQGNNQEVEQTQGTQQEGTQQQVIPTLATAEQIPQAITQTLQTLIPIGLVVFGIGLVIYLMRLLTLRLM